MRTRVRAEIVGRVQGVGFRPTVYRYATQYGLAGFVCNSPQGVTLEVEGEDRNVAAFFSSLTRQPPRQSIIAGIATELLDATGEERFEVIESTPDGEAIVQISPDLATCDDCLHELLDPSDRRFGYPFINCTNCGPRFTILRELPYDRKNTSMDGFPMCKSCDHEYHDPADRRFHAQPDACDHCGPRLELRFPGELAETGAAPLPQAQEILRRGLILAVKSLGGYHLACDATNSGAVARLRRRKRRAHKAFAVMFRDVRAAAKFCRISESEEAELLSVARPIVVLNRRHSKHEVEFWRELNHQAAANRQAPVELAAEVAPDTDTIGAFLPYTPLHHLLIQGFEALVMTSGNRTDEPILSDEAELNDVLGAVADAALTHNRPILHKCDDSVLRMVNNQRQFFRRARGFVPSPIRIAECSPHILAVGGELKNTFCLARNGNAFLSQHIGDLKEFKTYDHFAREIGSWMALMRVRPELIAHDLHPGYLSTRYAKEWESGRLEERKSYPSSHLPPVRLVPVQHHHAHIASVMAEHDLHETVIGVALDGTGYGVDGTVWGGEFLLADRAGFTRAARFKTYALPGGDKAVEEPWRMALSVLTREGLLGTAAGDIHGHKFQAVQQMIETGFHSPPTSSAGRLFDAVASILGLCDVADYEAQAAIRLETVADTRETQRYPFEVETREAPWALDFGPTIRAIVESRRRGLFPAQISARFHNTVAAAVGTVCMQLRAIHRIDRVALSGGVFQNRLLLMRTCEALNARGFRVFTNTVVPPNDGGLALGQAAVAAAQSRSAARNEQEPGASETASVSETSRNVVESPARGVPSV